MGLASIRRLGPLWRKSSTSSQAAAGALECGSLLPLSSCELARASPLRIPRSCARPANWPEQKRQQAAALQSPLFSANSVASVVSLLLGCGRLERHGEHRESRFGCGFAALSNKFNIQVFYRGKREGTVGRPKKAGVECYPPIPVNAHPLHRPASVLTFSHPDCTVGPGVSPGPGACRPSTLCPLIAPATLAILLLAGSLSRTPMR